MTDAVQITYSERRVRHLNWCVLMLAVTTVLLGFALLLEGLAIIDLKDYLRSEGVDHAMQNTQ